MPAVFIFGLFPESSGKTVLATALARGLANRGLDVAVFKPRSGHNMWYQYEAFLECKRRRSLFCEDIIKLREASGCPLPYELLNPVDALLAPLNANVFLEQNLTRRMFLFEGDLYRHLIAERYLIFEGEEEKRVLLVNERNINASIVMFDQDYLEELKANTNQVIPVNSLSEWTAIFNELGSKAICSCYQKIKREYSNLIIEGFNDSICPEPKIINEVNVVIGVAPGTAILYDVNEFKRIINAMVKLGKNPRALRAEDIAAFTRKYEILKIPPIPSKHLTDYDNLSRELKEVVDRVKEEIEKD